MIVFIIEIADFAFLWQSCLTGTDCVMFRQPKYSISQIQPPINQLVEVLRLISSGAMNCAPTFEREMLKASVGARFIASAVVQVS